MPQVPIDAGMQLGEVPWRRPRTASEGAESSVSSTIGGCLGYCAQELPTSGRRYGLSGLPAGGGASDSGG
jgi:hypothetical protein